LNSPTKVVGLIGHFNGARLVASSVEDGGRVPNLDATARQGRVFVSYRALHGRSMINAAFAVAGHFMGRRENFRLFVGFGVCRSENPKLNHKKTN
jgi:hypothetical protein